MGFILTRIQVGDYDTWKQLFDQDVPGARRDAKAHRVFRNADDPNEVFVMVEFASSEDAREGARRLLDSGVLDRFSDKSVPRVVEVAEEVTR
ncbi:MAG: hypothetical protein ACXVYV_07755 [Gaiellales bacterium]